MANFITQAQELSMEADKALMTLFDPQALSHFEMILYKADLTSSFLNVAEAVGETILAKFRVQTIATPFRAFNYEKTGDDKKYIQGQVIPDQITFTFIEDELATVRTYVKSWINDIAYWDVKKKMYIFRDNQLKAKRNAVINLLSGLHLPTPAFLKIEGIKFQSMGDLELNYGSGDPYIITVNCAIDTIDWYTASDLTNFFNF